MAAKSPHFPSRVPAYRRQREKLRPDRAYVKIEGKKVFLGTFGSAESYRRYTELVDPPDTDKSALPVEPTVAMVMAEYLEFTKQYYPAQNKRGTSEYHDLIPVLRHVKRLAGSMLAREFGPKKLKEVRQAFVDAGQCRKTVNRNVQRVRRMFKWAASEELVPGAVWQNLAAVDGLRAGRSAAPDRPPVVPVADAIVDATLPYLPEVVADMVRLQRLTGMRPGEICKLRPRDLDRTGEVWLFKLPQHKTTYRGKSRIVCLGPKAQAILLRYLARPADDCCFTPRDSEAKRRARAHAARKTPLSYGNRPGSKLVENPRWQVGDEYCADSYRRAIQRACDKAFPAPTGTRGPALEAWRKAHRWFPNQLRHSAATDVRREFGLEAAQIILGHAQADVTQIYAERDLTRGIEVAKRIG